MTRRRGCAWYGLGCLFLAGGGHAWTVQQDANGKLDLTGSFQFDIGRVSVDQAGDDDTSAWRRRRLGLDWTRGKHVELLFEYDFAAHGVTDAWMKWKTATGYWQLGQFKQPFLLDELNSDKRSLLLEAGLPHAFAPSRRMGAGWLWNPGAFGLQLSAFGRNLDGVPSSNGAAARGWWTPLRDDHQTLHLGLARTREDIADGGLAFSIRPESRLTALRAARTPRLADADRAQRVGAEALWLRGPWYAQAELAGVQVGRAASADFTPQGWYVQLGRSFGPGQRSYKQGTVQAIGAGGTVEIGVRAAGIDLDDGGVRGGRAHTWALGATWYLRPETRLMANLVDVERSGNAADFRVLEMRMQLVF